jgi:phosphodiesterase/alkaline phosphatase D-like protein
VLEKSATERRLIFGVEQKRWFFDYLQSSKATWKL